MIRLALTFAKRATLIKKLRQIFYQKNFDFNQAFDSFSLQSASTKGYSVKYNFSKQEMKINYQKNYYEILDLQESATLADIKKKFYQRAKQSHPDTNKGNQQLFKSINQAYNVLSHQERRKLYDTNRSHQQSNLYQTAAKPKSQQQSSQEHQQSEFQNKDSKSRSETKMQSYYNFNRIQWQQLRTGYQYHIPLDSQYYAHLTNAVSIQKLSRLSQQAKQKKKRKQKFYEENRLKYEEYFQKIKRKKQKNVEQYNKKLHQMEKEFYEKKKDWFRKTIIANGFYRVKNIFSKIQAMLLRKQTQNKCNKFGDQQEELKK